LPYIPGRYWLNMAEYSCGPIPGDAVHQLDLARFAMGDPPPPKAVTHTGGIQVLRDGRDTPDTQVATFEYDTFTLHFEGALWTPYMKKTPFNLRDRDAFSDWAFNATKIEILGTKANADVARQRYAGAEGHRASDVGQPRELALLMALVRRSSATDDRRADAEAHVVATERRKKLNHQLGASEQDVSGLGDRAGSHAAGVAHRRPAFEVTADVGRAALARQVFAQPVAHVCAAGEPGLLFHVASERDVRTRHVDVADVVSRRKDAGIRRNDESAGELRRSNSWGRRQQCRDTHA
jgi:hypothetical protein